MKDNFLKRVLSFLVLASILVFIFSCTKEEWEGKIYKEQGVTIVENRGPGLWGEEAWDKVQFIEDFSIGEYEGEDYLMFNRFLSVAVDSLLNIYILDRQNYRLLKFNRKGDFIWETGQKGQGPGEFQSPRDVALTPTEEIAIRDGNSIHFFAKDGSYQNTVKFIGNFRGFSILPDGRFLMNIWVRGELGVAAEYHSSEGKVIEKFPDEYRYGPKLTGGGTSYGGEFKVFGNKIYLSLPGTYEIREYDLEGKILLKIRRDFKIKPPNIKFEDRDWLAGPSDVSGPCFFYQGRMLVNLLNIVEILTEDKFEIEKFIDFFNEKGQFLGTYQLPESQTLAAIDSEGHFYFIQWDPYPKVIRSKLILF
jgi:hypothetical protein